MKLNKLDVSAAQYIGRKIVFCAVLTMPNVFMQLHFE